MGVLEIVADALLRVDGVHVAAGVAAALVTLRPRRVEPRIVALAAVFVAPDVVEAASPDLAGPDPSDNGSLILTGSVLPALVVAFVWPPRTGRRRDGADTLSG